MANSNVDIAHGMVENRGPYTLSYTDLSMSEYSKLKSTFSLNPNNFKVKPTEFRSAFYYGYIYEKAMNRKVGLHRIIPKIASVDNMVFSKSHIKETQLDRLASSKGLYVRIYPFESLITVGTKVGNIPIWVFSKKSYVKGSVTMTNTNAQYVSYAMDNAKMALLFFCKSAEAFTDNGKIFDGAFTAGLGAIMDGVNYLNLGNSHLRGGVLKLDRNTETYMDAPSGSNCTGGLGEFLYKPDINALGAPADTVFGWNSDLSRYLNTTIIASSPPPSKVLMNLILQLPSFVGFSFCSCAYHGMGGGSRGAIPYRLVPLFAPEFIMEGMTPPSIKHPNKPDLSIYSADMYLCLRENDPTFNQLQMSYLCKQRLNSQETSFQGMWSSIRDGRHTHYPYTKVLDAYAHKVRDVDTLFDPEKNGGLSSILIDTIAGYPASEATYAALPVSVYHTLFSKILDKVTFPEVFLEKIASDPVYVQECKKIAFLEQSFQVFAFMHQVLYRCTNAAIGSSKKLSWLANLDVLNDSETEKYVKEVIKGLYEANTDLQEMGKFILAVRKFISEDLIDAAVNETYDIAISLAA